MGIEWLKPGAFFGSILYALIGVVGLLAELRDHRQAHALRPVGRDRREAEHGAGDRGRRDGLGICIIVAAAIHRVSAAAAGSRRGRAAARRRGRSRSRCSPRSSSSPPAGWSTSWSPARWRATCWATRCCSSPPSSAPTCSRWAWARGCRATSSASWPRTSCASSCWWPGRRADAGAAVRRQSPTCRAPFRVAAVRAGAGRRHAGRARDPAGDAHPQAQRRRCKDLVSQVLTFDYLGALAVVDRLSAAAGAAARAWSAPALLFGLLNAAVAAVGAVAVPRTSCGGCGAHALACALTLRRCWRRRSPAPTASPRWPRTSFYHDAIVFTRDPPYQRIVVTRGRARLALFLNGNLQFAARDEYRYHEALVHPALAAHGAPRRCWCSAAATAWRCARCCKLPERRERHAGRARPGHDAAVLDARRCWRALNGDSLRSPKLHDRQRRRVRAGSQQHDEMFDVDRRRLPRPDQLLARQALHASVLRAARAAPGGRAATRWCRRTSPLFARKSFWIVATTIEAAGLTATPYHAHVPSFGEWGFVVASRRPFRLPDALPAGPALPHRRTACRRCSASRPTWRACRPR